MKKICAQCGKEFTISARQHMKKFCTLCSHKRKAIDCAERAVAERMLLQKNGKGSIRKAKNEEELRQFSSLNGYIYVPARGKG